MSELIYRGTVDPNKDARELTTLYQRTRDPAGYRPEPELVEAVNIALTIEQPLLLTGEPGTGKTTLADSVAMELDMGQALRFDVKSTSTFRELFYTTDSIGRFHAAQTGEQRSRPTDFLTYSALGEAIIRANFAELVADLLPPEFEHQGKPRKSVVLIDEVDKAPRDFPNDILAQLEEMYFRIPEIGNRVVSAEPEFRPIVIITSNSEKHLPDPFLRRCVYYDIQFPSPKRLQELLLTRFTTIANVGEALIESAIDLFFKLREEARLQKKPATAELVYWITALRKLSPESENPLGENPAHARSTLTLLVKSREDLTRARPVVDEWIQKHEA